jgi:Arc/MetJ-type ribon-helix-helix transcriptional regulator
MDGRASSRARSLNQSETDRMRPTLTIKLSKALCERARRVVEKAGYSSLEEFIEHAVERDLARLEEVESKEDLIKKLEGLGYLK